MGNENKTIPENPGISMARRPHCPCNSKLWPFILSHSPPRKTYPKDSQKCTMKFSLCVKQWRHSHCSSFTVKMLFIESWFQDRVAFASQKNNCEQYWEACLQCVFVFSEDIQCSILLLRGADRLSKVKDQDFRRSVKGRLNENYHSGLSGAV